MTEQDVFLEICTLSEIVVSVSSRGRLLDQHEQLLDRLSESFLFLENSLGIALAVRAYNSQTHSTQAQIAF